jgi:hypothetical protein
MSMRWGEVKRAERYALTEIKKTKPKDPSQVAEEVRLYIAAKRAKERRPAYRGHLVGNVERRHAV